MVNARTSPVEKPAPIDTVAPVILTLSTSVMLMSVSAMATVVLLFPTAAVKPVPAPLASRSSTGASLTAVTLMVRVLATGSRLTPPLAVPPVSSTLNVKLA